MSKSKKQQKVKKQAVIGAKQAERKAKKEAKPKVPRPIPAITPHSTEYSVNPDHSRYAWHATPVKGIVYDNGDAIATLFRAMTVEQCYDFVEAAIVKSGRPWIDLRAKYAHLNAGMQRMNLGNVIRGLAKTNPAIVTKPMKIKKEQKILAEVRTEPVETLA